MLVLRGLTIPSSLPLIVQPFQNPLLPSPSHCPVGIVGALVNTLGLLIGRVLVQYAGWNWIFWFVTIIGIGIGAVCLLLIRNVSPNKEINVKFDVPGVDMLTVSTISLIFAVSSESTKGRVTAYTLSPHLSSIPLILFLVQEAYTPPDDAVLPPCI